MGKRLHVSQPVVINTEFSPLNDSFYIKALNDDPLEQWKNDNTGEFDPDRKATPLTLTPYVTAQDADLGQSYPLQFSVVEWYADGVKVTNETDNASADYVIMGGKNLKVKKNVEQGSAVMIRCVAKYIDPRDAGLTYQVEQTVSLTTSVFARPDHPVLDIDCPSTQSYNPFAGGSALFVLTGKALLGGVDVTSDTEFVWHAMIGASEVEADTMPWYIDSKDASGKYTDTLYVNAAYGDDIHVVLRAKNGNTLHPTRAERTIKWSLPDVEVHVVSDEGSAIRGDMKSMNFGTIVNTMGDVMSDEAKASMLRFNWKCRKDNSSTITDLGWGQKMSVDASRLRNTKGAASHIANTLVWPEAYVLGAFSELTHGNETVTHDGQVVFGQSVYD